MGAKQRSAHMPFVQLDAKSPNMLTHRRAKRAVKQAKAISILFVVVCVSLFVLSLMDYLKSPGHAIAHKILKYLTAKDTSSDDLFLLAFLISVGSALWLSLRTAIRIFGNESPRSGE